MLRGFGCLRERAFALLFSAQLISTIGDVIASVAVPFAIIEMGGGAADIGLVLAARAVPLVLFLLVPICATSKSSARFMIWPGVWYMRYPS